MSYASESQKRAVEKYHNKFDVIRVRVPKDGGLKEKITAHAASWGESITQFAVRAMRGQMERDAAGGSREE